MREVRCFPNLWLMDKPMSGMQKIRTAELLKALAHAYLEMMLKVALMIIV